MKQNSSQMNFNGTDSWTILSPIEQSIKRKIEAVGVPLRDWNISINYGIKTGLNDAFIISGEKKDELIAADPKSAEIIRPILRGRDIKRYTYEFADLWLIATFPSRNYDINCYPAVRDYLLTIGKERLEQTGKTHIINGTPVKARKKTSNQWFETQDSISYWDDFSKQKIAYREISDQMNACIVEQGIFLNNKCYLITGDHIVYLLSILNSTLFNKVLLQEANITGGKGFDFMNKLCVPIPSVKIEEELCTLYELRKEATVQDSKMIDTAVDEIIYSLYGLSADEIAAITS